MTRLALLAVVVGLIVPLVSAGPAVKPVKKRGTSAGGQTAAALDAGWYYTWYIDPHPGVTAEFVPMIAHGKDANSWYWDRIAKLKAQGHVTTLLGFNEPERKAPGGEISVDDAIARWPDFERTGLRLGSPAPAYDKAGRAWLTDFMAKATAKHLRVDFIAVHWYGDVAHGPADAKAFLQWLGGMHEQFKKPVWITEFSGLNWGWLHHPITAEQNQAFAAALLPELERTPWLERYCWFDDKPANLFADKQRTQLSKLGTVYRDAK